MMNRSLLTAAIACALGCARPPLATTTSTTTASGPTPAAAAVPAEEHDATYPGVTLRDGQKLDARIHYALAGTPHRGANGQIDNAVLFLHWTSASSAVLRTPPFAKEIFAAGKPLDLAKHYVIFVDAFGHGKSSKPSDGLHARFPAYGYEDIVGLQHRVVTETLGIKRLHAIVGLSMGGMNAWQWAERFPDDVEAIVPIVAQPVRIGGRNLVWRRWVASEIRSDPTWRGGEYTEQPRGWVESFPIFRMMLDGVPHLDATIPDVAAANGFIQGAMDVARTMDANDVLYSLESSSDYDPSAKLEEIRARVFALNFGDDAFNPVELGILESSMKRVRHGTYVIQPGTPASYGHFTQAHPELWSAQLAKFMTAIDGP